MESDNDDEQQPLPAIVSTKRGLFGSSPIAARNFPTMTLKLPSKSTKVPSGHNRNSSRVTTSRGRANRATSARNGCSWILTRTPERVKVPLPGSASKRPKRYRTGGESADCSACRIAAPGNGGCYHGTPAISPSHRFRAVLKPAGRTVTRACRAIQVTSIPDGLSCSGRCL